MNRPTIKGSFMIPSSRFLFLQLKINPSYILMDLHINNSKILDFFRNHSNIDPQTFIASSIDFYEFVLSSISQNNTSQILPYILTQNNLLNNLLLQTNSLDNHLLSLRNDYQSHLKDIYDITLKNNSDYLSNTKNLLHELKLLLNSQHDLDSHNIITLLDKRLLDNNLTLINSTKDSLIHFKDIQHNDLLNISKDIQIHLSKDFSDISQLIHQLKLDLPNNLHQHLNTILQDLHPSKYHHTLHDLLHNSLSPIQLAIHDSHNSIKSLSNKFLNSSTKGTISENILESQLSLKFPNFNIQRTSQLSHSGDFIITSPNHHTSFLLENKSYDKNVSSDEVHKFLRDLSENNLSGILISQHSGIALKNNFQIDFLDNHLVALFIHHCNYDMDTISLAFDILLSISHSIHSLHTSDISIDQHSLSQLQTDYSNFISQRNELLSQLNNSIKSLKKLDLPSIKLLLDKFTSILPPINTNNNNFTCNICNLNFHNTQSLSAHKKKHKQHPNNNTL